MELLPSDRFPDRGQAGLLAFLGYVQARARERGRPQLASVSLRVPHIAPLAVLEHIYAPEELHFYMEQTRSGFALAGADAVVGQGFCGTDRFARAKAFAVEILENTVATGDLDSPLAGPHFFCGFAFGADSSGSGEAVASTGEPGSATVFVPRWQVAQTGEGYSAVANVQVAAETPLEILAARVWGAYTRFADFNYGRDWSQREENDPAGAEVHEPPAALYEGQVRAALLDIRAGRYNKIVLARYLDLVGERPWQPLRALNRLRERFPGCYAFSYGLGEGRSFIGASPEQLVELRGGKVLTEAIAGSIERGASAAEDAANAASLLRSAKDIGEHGYVRDAILRRLAAAGIEGQAFAGPRLLTLANVHHLQTPIQANAPVGTHLLDLAVALHPTPAVGGSPREAAVPRIRDLEQFDRGLYAGLIGYFDHGGEGRLLVGIRSAAIDGNRARLFAGAGIVEGSTPGGEYHETGVKLRAMLGALRGE